MLQINVNNLNAARKKFFMVGVTKSTNSLYVQLIDAPFCHEWNSAYPFKIRKTRLSEE